MKKLLYIGGFILPDRNAAAQRVVANAKIFRDLGYDVELIGLIRDNSANATFCYEGFKCTNLAYPTGIAWFNYLFDIKRYKALFQNPKPEIVIAYNFPAFALRRLIMYGEKNGIKVIGDVTEWYVAKGNFFYKFVKNMDIHYRMEVYQPNMDGLIVISKYLDNYYKQFGTKTIVLPPLVDKKETKWNINQTPDETGLKLMYAGTGSKKDRLDYIISTLERINNETKKSILLNIIGITEEKFCSLYGWQSEKIPPFVHFLGRIPHQEVLVYLKTSHFQIFIREDNLINRAGFPTKFVESISSGTMVLTTMSSDLKDYMTEGIMGYELDISSRETLYKSLLYVVNCPIEKLTNMRKKINTEMFDYRQYIQPTKKFIDSIISVP